MNFIGADHAGYALKEKLKHFFTLTDLGNKKFDKDDDYPTFAVKVAKAVVRDKVKGILVCGSSQGMCIAANKVKGIRAVSVNTVRDARLTRKHNDANVLCLSGRLGLRKAKKIIQTWINTPFSNEERHIRRIRQIDNG